MRVVVLCVLLFVAMFFKPCEMSQRCSKGSHLYTPSEGNTDKYICQPCERGTYMPETNQSHGECWTCSTVTNRTIEEKISDCNKTHDAGIICKMDGYYRRPGNSSHQGKCEPCSLCGVGEHVVQNCSSTTDTKCCREKYNFNEKSGICEKQPTRCTKGQFYNGTLDICIPCLDGYFMYEEHHRNHECIPCNKPELDEIIVKNCTKQSGPEFKCKWDDQFWTNFGEPYSKYKGECRHCTKCKHASHINRFVGRECTDYRDTVCCPKANMSVVDTDGGPKCEDPTPTYSSTETTKDPPSTTKISCDTDHYWNVSGCQPCPAKTYQNLPNQTSCKQCSDDLNPMPKACDRTTKTTSGKSPVWIWVIVAAIVVILGVGGFILYFCLIRRGRLTLCRRRGNDASHDIERGDAEPDEQTELQEPDERIELQEPDEQIELQEPDEPPAPERQALLEDQGERLSTQENGGASMETAPASPQTATDVQPGGGIQRKPPVRFSEKYKNSPSSKVRVASELLDIGYASLAETDV